MDMLAQVQMHEKRGEFQLAALLREIVMDAKEEADVIIADKRKADNLEFYDGDY